MSTVRTRKLVSMTLVVFTGLFLLHLSQSPNGLDFDLLCESKVQEGDSEFKASTVQSLEPSQRDHAPNMRSVLRNMESLGQQQPMKVAEETPFRLPEHIPSPKTILDPSVKYLAFMMYAGLSNQASHG